MKKKIIIILLIVIMAILLVPRKLNYTDGGTVEYRALIYSVKRYNTIEMQRGIEVKVLGITVYDGTYIEEMQWERINNNE